MAAAAVQLPCILTALRNLQTGTALMALMLSVRNDMMHAWYCHQVTVWSEVCSALQNTETDGNKAEYAI